MEDLQSSRRRQAQENLGLTTQQEQMEITRSVKKEGLRKDRRKAKYCKLTCSISYNMVRGVAKWMDRYYLDPILGLIPGFGDVISPFFVVPFIYVSIFKVRSVPLTLAVIYNVLIDVLIGLIPFYIGDICDFFNKAYVKNVRLIEGFVEDDKTIIEEVNRKAAWMGIMIAIVCYLIYLMVLLAMKVAEWIGTIWDWLIGLF